MADEDWIVHQIVGDTPTLEYTRDDLVKIVTALDAKYGHSEKQSISEDIYVDLSNPGGWTEDGIDDAIALTKAMRDDPVIFSIFKRDKSLTPRTESEGAFIGNTVTVYFIRCSVSPFVPIPE